MWIASKTGWYSVVKKGKPGEWQVRARVRKDLENLCRDMKLPASRIISSDYGDYSFRIIINAAERAKMFDVLQDGVDYANFKSEVGRHPDQSKHLHKYHTIWGLMMDLQPRKTYGSSKSSGTLWDDVERQMDERPERRDYSGVYQSDQAKRNQKDLNRLDDIEDVQPPRHAYSDRKREVVISEENKKVSRNRMRGLWDEFRASGKQGLMDFREWLHSRSAGERKEVRRKDIPKQSEEGHVGWYHSKNGELRELYKDVRGDLMSAPATRSIGQDGYRLGDWEAPRHLADQFALAILGQAA